jgi:hypothetical protein
MKVKLLAYTQLHPDLFVRITDDIGNMNPFFEEA